MQLISNIKSDDYNTRVVPYLIYKTMCSTYNKYAKRDALLNMDTYLYEKYKLSVRDVLIAIKGNIVAHKRGNQYIIYIDQDARLDDHILNNLVREIDYGSLEVKGIHLFDSSFASMYRRLNVFYGLYTIGSFNNVN